MKAVLVVGFWDPVLPKLQRAFFAQLEDQTVVWVPICRSAPHGDGDLRNFKGLLFDRLAVGVTVVRVLVVVMRGHDDFSREVQTLIQVGKDRFPGVEVSTREFKDGLRSAPEVIQDIRGFLGIPEEVPALVPIYDSLENLEDWCQRQLNGKVLIHARAIQAAKKSRFVDVPLIYRSLLLLGNEYRNMKMEGGKANMLAFRSKAAELGITITTSISECRAGEQGQEYYILYGEPPTKRLLDQHLKKGTSKDARICLRIYFLWDKDARIVVVGWLPGHLDNRAT